MARRIPSTKWKLYIYIYIYTRRKDGAKAPSLLDHFGHFDAKAQISWVCKHFSIFRPPRSKPRSPMLKPRYSSPNFDAEALIFVFELRCWDLQKPLQNPCAADFLGYFSGCRWVPEDLRKPLQKPPVQTISRDFVPNCPRRPFFRLPSGTQGPPKTLAKPPCS